MLLHNEIKESPVVIRLKHEFFILQGSSNRLHIDNAPRLDTKGRDKPIYFLKLRDISFVYYSQNIHPCPRRSVIDKGPYSFFHSGKSP